MNSFRKKKKFIDQKVDNEGGRLQGCQVGLLGTIP